MWASTCPLILTVLAGICLANGVSARIPQAPLAQLSTFHRSIATLQQRPTRTITYLLKTRGGSDVEDESEDFDDEEGVFDDFEMGDDGDDEFAEETIVDRFLEAYVKTPPLTKIYLTASFIVTTFGYMFNRNQFPDVFDI